MLASELSQPNKFCENESNTLWYQLPVNLRHPTIMKPLGNASTVRYTCKDPDSGTIGRNEFYTSKNGYCYLFTPGIWWYNIPLVGSASSRRCFVLLDCASPEGAILLNQFLAAALQDVNVAQFGGTTQTGADVAALISAAFGVLVMDAPATVAVSGAPATDIVLAANSTRNFLYIRNTSATATVYFSFMGVTPVLNRGVTLPPNEWVSFHISSGIVRGACHCIGTAAGTLAVQTGT